MMREWIYRRSRRVWMLLFSIALVLTYIWYYLHTPSSNDYKIDEVNSSTDRQSSFINVYERLVKSGDHQQRLPKCLIIGAKKGGTGALLHFLKVHPYIEIANREVTFFDNGTRFKKGLEWYRLQMPPSYPQQITIEKTANYFHRPESESRVHSMNSSIKILLVLRDPVERAISDYLQRVLRHSELGWSSFERMVTLPDTGEIKSNFKVLVPSYYDRHMKRWLKYFRLDQFHIVDSQDLVKDPHKVIHGIETFLNIPHLLKEDNFVFNRTKGFFCIVLDYGKQKCLPGTKGRKHPDVDEKVIKKLQKLFRPHNELLFKMIGKTFEWP